jgi:hypothetical protein
VFPKIRWSVRAGEPVDDGVVLALGFGEGQLGVDLKAMRWGVLVKAFETP